MANIFGSSAVNSGARIGKTVASRVWSCESKRDRVVLGALLPDRDNPNDERRIRGANSLANVQDIIEGCRVGSPTDANICKIYSALNACWANGCFFRYIAPYYVSSELCVIRNLDVVTLSPGELGAFNGHSMRVFLPDGDLIEPSILSDIRGEEMEMIITINRCGDIESFRITDLIVYTHVQGSPYKWEGFVGCGFWDRCDRISFDGIPYVRASEAAPLLPVGFVSAQHVVDRETGLLIANGHMTSSTLLVYWHGTRDQFGTEIVLPTNPLSLIFSMGRVIGDSLGSAPIASGGATLPMGASGNFVNALNACNDGDGIWMYAPKKSISKDLDPIEAISLENAVDGLVIVGKPGRTYGLLDVRVEGEVESQNVTITAVLDDPDGGVKPFNPDAKNRYLSSWCLYVTSRQSGNREKVRPFSLVGTFEQLKGIIHLIVGQDAFARFNRIFKSDNLSVVFGDKFIFVRSFTFEGETLRLVDLAKYDYKNKLASVFANGTWSTFAVRDGISGKYDDRLILRNKDDINAMQLSLWSVGVAKSTAEHSEKDGTVRNSTPIRSKGGILMGNIYG